MPKPDKLEENYRAPYLAYATDPSPQNTGQLLRAIDPVLKLGVRTYGGGDSPLVYSRARQIALGALPRYNPTRASLKTHLMPHLQGLRRYSAQLEQPLSVPEQVLLDHHRLHSTSTELADELGREPSDSELSDRAGMSRKRIAYVRTYRPALTEGQVRGRFQGEDEESVNEPAVEQPSSELRHAEFLYHDLDPHDQVILERTLGLHGHPRLPAKEIARMLNLSPSAISQRAMRIQKELDELGELSLF